MALPCPKNVCEQMNTLQSPLGGLTIRKAMQRLPGAGTHNQEGDAKAPRGGLHHQRRPGREGGEDAPHVSLTLQQEGSGADCRREWTDPCTNSREWAGPYQFKGRTINPSTTWTRLPPRPPGSNQWKKVEEDEVPDSSPAPEDVPSVLVMAIPQCTAPRKETIRAP